MTAQDLILLTKKIGIGIVVTAVPAFILVGGLWLTQHTLVRHAPPATSVRAKGSR